MDKIYLAKQKVFNRNNKVFANELLFRDHAHGIKDFPTDMKATSHVVINSLINIDSILNESTIVLVNVNEDFLLSGLVDILDKSKFMLEILETTDLTEEVISRIKQFHRRGFKIAIDDFDCSSEMIKKFNPIMKYIHLVKIDVIEAESENIENVVAKLKKIGMKILAEKIETKEEYQKYFNMGFDLFQGYYLHKPETLEVDRGKDVTQHIILNLIKLIKDDAGIEQIEFYIKQRPELSLKLIKFLNSQGKFDEEIESIVQVVTLLGRDKLLRWLLLYLYSEMSDNPVSEQILAVALKRAEIMEEEAVASEKDKAYISGMFSMIGALFDTDNEDIIKNIKLDKDITDLVIRKKGKFLSSLLKSEQREKEYLKKLCISNFDKIDTVDIIYTLGLNGIDLNKNKI
ncbi:EAL and HDOD domain-containing protein [Sulfurimonas sp.]